ncbi:hypothetical protein ACHAXH_006065 [Discostella pseudostelligera]
MVGAAADHLQDYLISHHISSSSKLRSRSGRHSAQRGYLAGKRRAGASKRQEVHPDDSTTRQAASTLSLEKSPRSSPRHLSHGHGHGHGPYIMVKAEQYHVPFDNTDNDTAYCTVGEQECMLC